MIELECVTFRYNGSESDILKDISLQVNYGECLVVTGSSGCGKTTLTRLVNGLIPHFHSGKFSGNVRIDGKEIAGREPHELAPIVGSVFQNPRTQFFNTDTDSELVFGMENCGITTEEMQQRYAQTVKLMDLESLCHRDIFALSGGEKQRVAFGSVHALSPHIYILDEPSANLDAIAIEYLRDILMTLKQQGKTILISEHRLYYLRGIADRVALLKNGAISSMFSAEELAAFPVKTLNEYGFRTFSEFDIKCDADISLTEKPAIKIEGLSASHRKSEPVFCGVNMTVDIGEIVGLTGPNGIGKTTLARTVCGLMRERRGKIRFSGKAVKTKHRNNHAYLVMQDPNYQLFSDSVETELKLTVSGKPPDEKEMSELIRILNLDDTMKKHPLSLSGGQKQRLSIALAALSPASVLVFDEPTSGLDFVNMKRVSDILKMLSNRGKAILVISHDNEFLSMVCTRIISFEEVNMLNKERKESNHESRCCCSRKEA